MKKFKKNIKFILACIGLMILGGIVGFVGSSFSLGKLIYGGILRLGNFVDSNIYPIFCTFAIVIDLLVLVFYLSGKKNIQKSLKNDEDIINETQMSISIALMPIGVVGVLILLVNSFKVNLEREFNPSLFAISSILAILTIIYLAFMQYLSIKFLKSYNPEKYDNVLDLKFSKKFLESMDERERFETYKASYKGFQAVMTTLLILMFIFAIIFIDIESSMLPVYLLALAYLVGIIAYMVEAIKS